jgi:hypothetical protein
MGIPERGNQRRRGPAHRDGLVEGRLELPSLGQEDQGDKRDGAQIEQERDRQPVIATALE